MAKNKTWWCLLLLPISIGYFLFGVDRGLWVYDEGIILYGASKILGGNIPYKDFWTLYAPLQFYTVAGLFKIGGMSIFISRVYYAVSMGVLSFIVFLLVKKLIPGRWALICWTFTVIWGNNFNQFLNPTPQALIFSLLSILILVHFFRTQNNLLLIVSGSVGGISVLFKQNIGGYILIVVGVMIFFHTFFNSEEKNFLNGVKNFSLYTGGAVLLLLLPAIYFLKKVPFEELVYDLIIFPVKIFPKVRNLPYPFPFPHPIRLITKELSILKYAEMTIIRFSFYFPLIVYGGSIFLLISKQTKFPKFILLFFTILGLVFFNSVRIRSAIPHLLPTSVISSILFSLLLYLLPRIRKIGLIFFLCWLTFFVYQKIKKITSPPPFSFTLQRAKKIKWKEQGKMYEEAIKYVQKIVPKEEPIFVGELSHSKIVINDILFYFLSCRESGVKYYELHPGLIDQKEIQLKIIQEIKEKQIKYVVLRGKTSFPYHNIDSLLPLDKFLHSHFIPIQRFGDYLICKKSPNLNN